MRWFRFAILLAFAAVLQAGLFANINIKPDLLLILLIFCAVYCNTTDAIITSFTIGFVADVIGFSMGPQMISFGLFGVLSAYLNRIIVLRAMPYQAAVIFIAGFLAGVLALLLTFIKGQPPAADTYQAILTTSIYSAVAGPFLFMPCAWWMRIKTHRFSQK